MKEGYPLIKRLLLLTEIIVFAVLAVVASNHFGWADGTRITIAYLVAYLVPRIILSRARGTSITAIIILFLISSLLIAADYTNLLEWTSYEGYSLELPNVQGDARNYYKWALAHYDQRITAPDVVFPGFPLLMVGLWKVFGLSVIWPQAMNLMFTLTSVVLTGMTTRRLLSNRVAVPQEALLSAGVLLSCLLAFFLINGINILKEASTYLGVSMSGYVLASMTLAEEERHHRWRDFMLFVLACALLTLIRTTTLYFIALGVVIMMFPNWRRNWKTTLVMLGIVLVFFVIGEYFSNDTYVRHSRLVNGGWHMQWTFAEEDAYRSLYNYVIGYYYLYSPIHRLSLLPFTLSVQFIIPFPWLNNEDPTFANYICRISYGWYLVGGISLFYFIYTWWHKHGSMGSWPWWPAVSYVAITYALAGSMTRYIAPFELLFVPVAVFVLCRLREGRFRKAFVIWGICFVVVVAMTLLLCLELQQGTISKMLHTQPLIHYLKNLIFQYL
jgi:hypothetical protein